MSAKIKIMLELEEDEYEKYFNLPKAEFKEKTGKYRNNTDVWRDQMAAKEQYERLSVEKSQKIELLFLEKTKLMDDVKQYIESQQMVCPKCGHKGMSIKLDYDVLAGWRDTDL